MRTAAQNKRGSLSASSRDTQATRGRCAAGNDRFQRASCVVFPKPAGAETTVRGYVRLFWSKLFKRERQIKGPRTPGTKNFVAASWFSRSAEICIEVFSIRCIVLLTSAIVFVLNTEKR